jgi:hypothetical protein
MKNYFKLEVFKNGTPFFEKMVPTILMAQVVTQWTMPSEGYSVKMTFDNGLVADTDTWFATSPVAHDLTLGNPSPTVAEEKARINVK